MADSPARALGRSDAWVLGAVAVVGVAVRGWLIVVTPLIPPGDSYTRLVDPEVLVKGPWLPGYQLTLAMVAWFTHAPDAFRWMTALQGVLAAALWAWFALRRSGSVAALVVGGLIAVLPTFSQLSTALYPESLFLLFLGLAACASDRSAWWWVTLVGAACLVRYEGSLIAGSWCGAMLLRRRWGVALGLVVAPAAWDVYSQGISPSGSAWLHPVLSMERVVSRVEALWRLGAAAGLGPVWLGAGIVVLAGMFSGRGRAAGRFLAVAAAFVLFLAVVDPYSSPDNPRQVCLLALLGVLALGWSFGGGRFERWVVAGVMAATLVGLPARYSAIAAAPVDPVLAQSVAVGKALAPLVAAGRKVVVLADGFPRWPDAVAAECEYVTAYAEVASTRLFCNRSIPDADVVVRLGAFDDWKPVHIAAAGWVVQPEWTKGPLATPDLAVWVRGDVAALAAALAGTAAAEPLPDSARCRGWPSPDLEGWDITLGGPLTVREPPRIAMYGNGSLTFTPTRPGMLSVAACGTAAAGRGPQFTVAQDAASITLDAPPAMRWLTTIPVSAGLPVTLTYTDDAVDSAGRDRNLFVAGVRE